MPKQQVIYLRTSERSQRCRQAWWWSFVEQIKPKTAAPALRFGSLVHQAMEKRYKKGVRRGPHPAKTFLALYEQELEAQAKMGFRDEDGTWHEAGELGEVMLNNFVDTYGADEEWEVIASEMPFQVTLHETPRFKVVYVGIIDGVWRNRSTKKIWINDWKTAKSISTKHLVLDEQAGAYWGFGPEFLRQQGIIKPKDELQGILFTFMRKAKPDPRPRNQAGLHLNKDGSVSKQQPAPYFERVATRRNAHESLRLRERALSEARDMMRVRMGKSDVYINPSAMNCAMCGYRDICELQESGHDFENLKKMTMIAWDPYAEHEIDDRK
jgi:hypothetical protein